VRGTGCSGGVFDFFQPAEGVDGYEMVEWLAAREWSAGRVATVGKSYPGITQLFTANTAPPSLVAIAPGHYFADVYRDVAFPGGIFNYAFAALWSFVARPASDYPGVANDVFAGDQTCAEHQAHNATSARYNPFVQAQEHTTDDPLIRDRSPLYGAHNIDVPVFQALSWQDEQLASRNVRFLEDLERLGVDYRAVLSNGDHGTYREPEQLRELDRFFEAHLEQREVLRDGTALEDYLAEPSITVLWEQDETSPRWATTLEAWSGAATPWRIPLVDMPLQFSAGATPDGPMFAHNPTGQQGIGNAKWGGGPDFGMWDKYSPPPGSALAFTALPFEEDVTLLGSASADLWITATAPNVDLQVTLTEVRADGTEVYVQQGWLRTSQRALDASRSTELAPYQTHSRYDQQPLSASEPSLARVEIFPFGHVFREGSSLRLWIEAPTAAPQLWGFAADPTPAVVTVHVSEEHRSSLVLPLVDAPIPAEFAGQQGQFACGTAVRLECRPDPLA
jgi:putative CocE/NonD family hydrolase